MECDNTIDIDTCVSATTFLWLNSPILHIDAEFISHISWHSQSAC